MQDRLIQFQDNLCDDIRKFTLYSSTGDIVWTHINYNVGIESPYGCIGSFLSMFLGIGVKNGIPKGGYKNYIKKENNVDGILCDFHGILSSLTDPRNPDAAVPFTKEMLSVSLTQGRLVPDSILINRETYELREIGINIAPFYQRNGLKIFDHLACHVQLKYALTKNTNDRIIVNIHFKHINQRINIEQEINYLDNIVSSVTSMSIINNIKSALKVDIFNFEECNYFIADKSLPFYFDVLKACSKKLKHTYDNLKQQHEQLEQKYSDENNKQAAKIKEQGEQINLLEEQLQSYNIKPFASRSKTNDKPSLLKAANKAGVQTIFSHFSVASQHTQNALPLAKRN